MTEVSRSESKRRTCAGTRADGGPCTAPVMGPGEFCFAHDPSKIHERQAARIKGGRRSATRGTA